LNTFCGFTKVDVRTAQINESRESLDWPRVGNQVCKTLFDPELYALVPDGVVTVTGKLWLAGNPEGMHA
jgi:hypothetical protein